MSREKQIEEMTCEKCLHYEMCLEKFRNAKKDGFCEFVDEEEYFSHADECDFFVTGYRKQSEWISAEERLPEKEGRYLVYGSIGGMPLVCGAHYDKYNGFGDDDFTHWMPLPEPPKGD